MSEHVAGTTEELTPGTVTAAGPWAVGNASGERFAVSKHCRHLYADLSKGTIDSKGCLVCPWHGSRYDPKTGRMVKGPQGIFAKIPGMGRMFTLMTRVMPLRRGTVEERDGSVIVR